MLRHLLLTLLCLAITLPASSAFGADCNDNGIDDAWETSPMGPDDPAGLYFPGSNAQYAMLDPMSGMPGEAFTISLWMRTANTEPAGLLSYIIPGYEGLLLFLVSSDTQLHVCGRTLDTSLDLATDAWIHLAITWESTIGELIVYLDGVLAYTGTITHPDTIIDGGVLVLGQDMEASNGGFYPGRAFDGQMNEVRIWDHARTQVEIANDRFTPLQGDEPGLVAYWKMDEGVGTVLTDEVVGQDMTLHDTVWVPYSDADGDGLPDDCIAATNLTQGTVHEVIQEAINLAVHGDEIVVHPGEHFENLDLHGKQIVLRSENPTDPGTVVSTIINGGGGGRVITCDQGETVDTLISGFVITNGIHESGGGMRIEHSNPTVTNCSFTGNSASGNDGRGGGMSILRGDPIVMNCRFAENSATLGGGLALESSSATVTNCTFTRNSTTNLGLGLGGGMGAIWSSPTVTNCGFSENSATWGGGLYASGGSSNAATVANCSFTCNSASEGGGVYLNALRSASLINCTVTRNSAEHRGSGIYLGGFITAAISNSTVCENTSDNDDGGIYCGGVSNSTVTDSTVCGNTPHQIDGTYTDGGGNLINPHVPPPLPIEPDNPCPEDINGDGVVDQQDLGALLAVYEQNCP
jgi:Concanavalin A-like lectin/glucanases superfamily